MILLSVDFIVLHSLLCSLRISCRILLHILILIYIYGWSGKAIIINKNFLFIYLLEQILIIKFVGSFYLFINRNSHFFLLPYLIIFNLLQKSFTDQLFFFFHDPFTQINDCTLADMIIWLIWCFCSYMNAFIHFISVEHLKSNKLLHQCEQDEVRCLQKIGAITMSFQKLKPFFKDHFLQLFINNQLSHSYVQEWQIRFIFPSCSHDVIIMEPGNSLASYDRLQYLMDLIELRSDIRTTPTKELREAITTSLYGDWTYNEDQAVKELQAYTAKLFGKEDAAYVISGVFGNQVSILTATKPGDEILLWEGSHVIKYENGSVGKISRAMTRPLECPEGYITPKQLKKVLRKKADNQSPNTSLVVLEFPTTTGIIPPIDLFNQCCLIAKQHGLHVHVDGARVHNALAELKIDPAEAFKNASSLTFCLSKGLCSPVGSVIVGDKAFISRLKVNRKMLGGVMRKPGVLAGPGLLAMKTIRLELGKDNEMARLLASKMKELGWIDIVVPVETNMVFFKFTDQTILTGPLLEHFNSMNIKTEWGSTGIHRFVIHHYIREEQVERIIQAFRGYRQPIKPESK